MPPLPALAARLILLAGLGPALAAAAPPPWAEDLLGMTGTVSVFDTPAVRQALGEDGRNPDLEKLIQSAGYRPWPGARLWLVEQGEDLKLRSAKPDALLRPELDRRGLMIEERLTDQAVPDLMTALQSAAAGNRKALAALPGRVGVDAIVIVSRGSPLKWQLVLPDFTLTGSMEGAGRNLMPHVWAENLALQWQWPALRQAGLIEVRGITGFAAFRLAETALGTVCRSVRVLRVQGEAVTFACQNGSSATIPEKAASLPWQAEPWADHGLDDQVLMGRQLSNRTAIFLWQGAAP